MSDAIQGSSIYNDLYKSGDTLTLSSIYTTTDIYINDKTYNVPRLEIVETINIIKYYRNSL